jgi:DNA-binding PadR family transcriptional regulator
MSRLPRLSPTERAILELLREHGEMFGLAMVKRSESRLKRGTIYVILGRMQAKGYLESRQEQQLAGTIGLPRRLYKPTGHALRVLAAWHTAEAHFATPPLPQKN